MKTKTPFVFIIVVTSFINACTPGETVETEVSLPLPSVTPVSTTVPTPEMESVFSPIIYRGSSTTDIPTLDPQVASDSVSITYLENLFVNLTNYDLETSEVVPEAATSWEISPDGKTYTFHLRTDIPWVWHNPVTGETIQDVDGEGELRFVTAYDFVYGFQRTCHPELGSYYSSIIARVLKGCEEMLEEEQPYDPEGIGVTALDDATLVINLTEPASYFLSMTPMWTLSAVPQWTIEEHGDEDWIEAGVIVTSGRYVLAEWVHGVRRVLVRNWLMPEDMRGSGNIEVFDINTVPDGKTAYGKWKRGEVEQSGIPSAELEKHLEDYPDETDQIADLAVFYIAFDHSRPPFDDWRVRAAFSAAFEREPFIQEVRQGQGLPMKHFAPPGIFGAPPIDEIGVGYDPEYAREMLAEAGYPGCDGFPEVILLGYSGASTLAWIEYAHENWERELGCDPEVIKLEQLRFCHPCEPPEPHLWTLGWGPDYADENNWVGDVLWCEGSTRTMRPCTWIDDLIVQARHESDPEIRKQLYREIEYGFFGYGGEFPIAPIFLRIAFLARHEWLTRTPALFGGDQWYNWTMDMGVYLDWKERQTTNP